MAHTLNSLMRARFVSDILLVVPGDFIAETEEMLMTYSVFTMERPLLLHAEGGKISSGSRRGKRLESQSASPGSAEGVSVRVVEGGIERQDSVFNALQSVPTDCEWVLIHDGVRPFVSQQLLEDTWGVARKTGASVAALPATDTVKRVRDGLILETLRREEIWLMQTPQVFRKQVLLEAYRRARQEGWSATDDAAFVERTNVPISIVMGERSNIKVTTPDDLVWAEWFLSRDRNRTWRG